MSQDSESWFYLSAYRIENCPTFYHDDQIWKLEVCIYR